ncbi:MAG TPA: family 16 glycoside hydrolase [Gemmatimonadaceae bacterium]
MPRATESTSFTKDVQGRYLCNDVTEVNAWQGAGARPFDFIVVGGGTFGAAIAEHLWFRQKENASLPSERLRTLVIEAGPFTVPEHVQNTAIQGFSNPFAPFFLNENAPQPEAPVNEVWGVPWKSAIPFMGLAYAIGGRSVYWGGWAPRLLDAEMTSWPPATVQELNGRYFDESTRQIGVDDTNDFIFGELQNVLRKVLFDGLGGVNGAIPLAALPPSPVLAGGGAPADLLGLTSTAGLSAADLLNLLKLEAPLAVQARPPHAGFFPMNKFSTVPLLMKATRQSFSEFGADDARRDFMVLPRTHVLSLRKTQSGGTWRVTGVETSSGFIELAPGGAVVMALGTIENARLALVTFDGSSIATLPLMGKNLTAHLRSNLTFTVARTAIPGLSQAVNELQTAALFVKGLATKNGAPLGHFHLQISASGGARNVNADQELFQKVPDVDFFDALKQSTDTHVAIAIRGIGEIAAADLTNVDAHASRVELDGRADEYGVRRARVTLVATQRENDLQAAMDQAMIDVARLFGAAQVPQPGHDGLGTTHHETGGLWMHDDPTKGVTDDTGRFHFTENLYAAGPALFPTIGSPNPMLTGIALSRRTGDHIMKPRAFVASAGFQSLFDGQAMGNWRMSTIRNQPGRDNPGTFLIRRGAFETLPGTDLGLLWLNQPTPARYALRLQFMMTAPDDNSGVFIGFPNPEGENYDNTAYVGVNLGFEIQIDETARPDGLPIHRTGAIYSFKGATDGQLNVRPVGEWNQYEITVDGANLTIALNGAVVNRFVFNGDPQSPRRGLTSTRQEPRFIGLQTHTGRVHFRNVEWKAL